MNALSEFPVTRCGHPRRAPSDIITRDPEIIIGSWCGRAVKKDWIRAREGWEAISAVKQDHIYEVKSAFILQPGPAALTEGVRQLHAIIAHALKQEIDPDLRPKEKADSSVTGATVV